MRTNYYVVKKKNLEVNETSPYLCHRAEAVQPTPFTNTSHHIMNTMNNPKLQAMLDLFEVVGAEAVRNCGTYDALTCEEQMLLEQLIED